MSHCERKVCYHFMSWFPNKKKNLERPRPQMTTLAVSHYPETCHSAANFYYIEVFVCSLFHLSLSLSVSPFFSFFLSFSVNMTCRQWRRGVSSDRRVGVWTPLAREKAAAPCPGTDLQQNTPQWIPLIHGLIMYFYLIYAFFSFIACEVECHTLTYIFCVCNQMWLFK